MTTRNDIWVIFRVATDVFGVPVSQVKEMVRIPSVTFIPTVPDTIRGTINLRGTIYPLVDLRKCLGFETAKSEANSLVALLGQREQDHRKWIAELESSVAEKRQFKLTTDPTQCAFGKWYYSFKTENLLLKNLLGKFEAPHRHVHQLGVHVQELMAEHRTVEAQKLIEVTKDTVLQELLNLFKKLYEEVGKIEREIAIVMETVDGPKAFAVDAVVSVESILDDKIDDLESIFGRTYSQHVKQIGKRRNNLGLVMLLDSEKLLTGRA